MTTAKRFEDLDVWQRAKELTNYIALEQGYRTDDEFKSAFSLAELCSKQPASLIRYLQPQPNTHRTREDGVTYDV